MPRPTFSLVLSKFPFKDGAPNGISRDDLFREIGFDAYISNPNYDNTCAIRMSLALVKSGFYLPAGRSSHIIQKGPEKKTE
jgi:hypothetical protein